jgi:serine phosphatase RsbU (regulator of sigma subunit)
MEQVGASTILIVDDNPDMIFLIQKGFEGEGYHLLESGNGAHALELMRETPPDLVLLDLKLPGLYGIQVLEEMRADPHLKDIPVIVLTVVDDDQEKVGALQKGASDFLVKPPLTEELKARVRTHLRLRHATEELRRYSRKLEGIVAKNSEELRRYATSLEEMVEEKVGVIRKQNRELMENLQAAHKIQHGMLPTVLPEIRGMDLFVRYHPSMPVGGDFYDIFRIDDRKVGIFIADVSGHGMGSALITVFLKQELTYSASPMTGGGASLVDQPRDTLTRLNRTFFSLNLEEENAFVTLVYCTFDTETGELTCSVAGHHALPCIKRSSGEVDFIEMQGFPIGWFDQVEDYEQKSVSLQHGDTLFLYTDGLIEILGEYPESRIKDHLQAAGRFLAQDGVADRFDELYKKRKAAGPLHDDVTLVGLRISE